MRLRTSFICEKVLKKSQSPAFKNLQEGDRIDLTVEVKPPGRASRGTRAVYIHCFNPQTRLVSDLTFNQIGKTLECFVFTEAEPDYQDIMDTIWAKRPEPPAYVSSTLASYENGYTDAKKEIMKIIKTKMDR